MPTRETAPIGAPCWVDLMTSDTDGSRAFYGELFGWTAEEPNAEFGGYFNFTKDGVRVAGCMASQPDRACPTCGRSTWPPTTPRRRSRPPPPTAARSSSSPWRSGTSAPWPSSTDAGGAAIGMWQPGTFTGLRRARPRPARRAGSSCTPATTTPPSPSTATCSAGTRTPMGDTPRVPLHHAQVEGDEPAGRDHGRLRLPARGRARPLVGLLRRRRRRRRPGQDRRARRVGRRRPPRTRPTAAWPPPPTPPAPASSSSPPTRPCRPSLRPPDRKAPIAHRIVVHWE